MLKNYTILITGGGSGIGAELAVQLANHNKIIVAGRNESSLKSVAEKHPNISHYTVDVSDHSSIDGLFTTLRQKGIILNAVINNAGVAEVYELEKTKLSSSEIFQKINTNFAGAVAVTQLFIAQADRTFKNLIINITTEVAIFPVPILPLYSASKAGLSVFTQCLKVQLQKANFSVIEILPPAIDTNMARSLNNTNVSLKPGEFARNAIRAIEKQKDYAPGKNVLLLKMMRSFFPRLGLRLVDTMSRKLLSAKK